MSENISELGQALLDRVREAINEEWGRYTDQAPEGWETEPFVVTFLRSRDGCVPDEYLNEDDARDSIVLMFGFVFWSIAEAIEDTAGVRVSVAIEPDLMNETRVVMYSMELRTLLLVVRKKAWRLHWESEAAMAKDLENWYTHALIALKQAQKPRRVTAVVTTSHGVVDEIKIFANENEALAALEEWAEAEGFASYEDYQAHAAWSDNDAYMKTVAVKGANDEQQVTVTVPVSDDFLQILDLWQRTGSTPQTSEEALADYLRFLAVYVKNRESESADHVGRYGKAISLHTT